MSTAVLVNDLGDGFITFPEFQRQLRDYERAADVRALLGTVAPSAIIAGHVVTVQGQQRFVAHTNESGAPVAVQYIKPMPLDKALDVYYEFLAAHRPKNRHFVSEICQKHEALTGEDGRCQQCREESQT